jgi:hypothetical protein
MPVSKQRYSRSEKAAYLARAEKMIAAGVNMQIREEWREHAPARDTLNIAVAGSCATFVFDLTAGRAGYVVSVRLVGQALGAVLDCRLTTAWDDHIVLASFSDYGDAMCKLGHLQYPKSQVLNPRIANSMRFAPGQTIEGLILATGANPIPEAYRHGLIVPIGLTFLDQDENEMQENADLFVDRLYKPKRKFVPRGTGLYDRGTIVPTTATVTNWDPTVSQTPAVEARLPRKRGREEKTGIDKTVV